VESGGARGSVQAAAFATVTFALTTPKRIVATYLILSGMFRTATAYVGEWAGLPQAELVVIASRRKKDWKAGVVVITPDKAYRLGEPFDETTPDGLRTIYPLTSLEPGELIRRSVHYELPPLRER
jgi:hypothetical protein